VIPTRAQLLADQAALYGQVDNATWFADRIASHRAAGEHELAEEVAAIANSHHIRIPCGEQLVPVINMRVRQAS
jgi:hypothetical protein